MKCECCGKNKKRVCWSEEYEKNLCDSCWKMYKHHPVKYIPPKGEVHYDEEGNFICHECGRSFKKLSGHIKARHNLSNDEYREKYELNRSQGLTGKNFVPNIVVDITTVSSDTRFKLGHKYGTIKRRAQAVKNKTKNDKKEAC